MLGRSPPLVPAEWLSAELLVSQKCCLAWRHSFSPFHRQAVTVPVWQMLYWLQTRPGHLQDGSTRATASLEYLSLCCGLMMLTVFCGHHQRLIHWRLKHRLILPSESSPWQRPACVTSHWTCFISSTAPQSSSARWKLISLQLLLLRINCEYELYVDQFPQ